MSRLRTIKAAGLKVGDVALHGLENVEVVSMSPVYATDGEVTTIQVVFETYEGERRRTLLPPQMKVQVKER